MFADFYHLWSGEGDCGGGLWRAGGVGLTEIRGESEEIGNGDFVIVVGVPLTPENVCLVEVRGKINEIRNRNHTIDI